MTTSEQEPDMAENTDDDVARLAAMLSDTAGAWTHEACARRLLEQGVTMPDPPPEPDIVDAEIIDDGDTLDLLRRAIEGTPPHDRGAGGEAGPGHRPGDGAAQKLPTDFESLPKFPAVLAALAAELVEAAA